MTAATCPACHSTLVDLGDGRFRCPAENATVELTVVPNGTTVAYWSRPPRAGEIVRGILRDLFGRRGRS